MREGPVSGLAYLGNLSNKQAINNLTAFSPTWEESNSEGSRRRLSHPLSVLSCLSKRADSKLSDGTNSRDEYNCINPK